MKRELADALRSGLVADSGPLIALALAGCLHLLRDLYGKVLVPDAVWREVTEGGQGRAGAAEMASASWLERRKLDRSPDPPLRAELGSGEAEAITLGADRNGLLIVDGAPGAPDRRNGLWVAGARDRRDLGAGETTEILPRSGRFLNACVGVGISCRTHSSRPPANQWVKAPGASHCSFSACNGRWLACPRRYSSWRSPVAGPRR